MKSKNMVTSLEELSLPLIQAWRQIVKSPGPVDYLLTREFQLCHGCVKEVLAFLKEGQNWFSLWERSPLLGAYMVYFFPLHYQQASFLFSKLAGKGKEKSLGRVLDVGSGPGPFTLAALEAKAKEVYALDANDRCLTVLSEFMARLGHTLCVREWNFPKKLALDGVFDTIVLGHSFLEMSAFTPERALHLISQLLPYLAPQGTIWIVEYDALKHKKALHEIQKVFSTTLKKLAVEPIEKLSVPIEKTRLMADIARAIKVREGASELFLLKLTRSNQES